MILEHPRGGLVRLGSPEQLIPLLQEQIATETTAEPLLANPAAQISQDIARVAAEVLAVHGMAAPVAARR